MKALVSYQIAKRLSEALGIDVIPLNAYKCLDSPVASHADMLFCVLDKTVFCYEDYVKENNLYEILVNEGYDIVFVAKECQCEYPNDISLNALVMGKTIFSATNHTAKEILNYANENGYKTVNIKQGYSACSTLVIDENHAVTSDKGIYKALLEENKHALLIDNKDITLPGYNCGFIGGASGVINHNVVVFGDVSTLCDYDAILEFLRPLEKNIISISQGRVYDFGGFKLI